jgi:YegS/Rv2252/BmrU family lipid kinase
MNLRPILFIVNPAASRGRTLDFWNEIRQSISAGGLGFDEVFTDGAGAATRATREALAAGVGTIVAVGGDGTLSEVVNGFFDERGALIDPRARLGLLACGTGSDFSRSIGLSNRERALSAILTGENCQVDLARVELADRSGQTATRYMINVASFGLGGETVALVNGWREKWPRWIGGRARFVIAAARALQHHRNRRVAVQFDDGREVVIETNIFLVANGRYAGGGMMLAPEAAIDDGYLDVILTDRMTRREILRQLPRISHGAHLSHPKVSAMRGRVISVDCESPMPVEIDGELAGQTPARFAIIPGAIRFIAPSR